MIACSKRSSKKPPLCRMTGDHQKLNVTSAYDGLEMSSEGHPRTRRGRPQLANLLTAPDAYRHSIVLAALIALRIYIRF